MRVFAAWILALGVAVAPAMAAGTDKEAPASTARASAAASPAAPASPAEARMENELQQMRDLLEAQSKQIQQQNEQLKQQQQQMQTLAEQLRATSAATANLAAAPVAALVPTTGVVAANAPAQQAPADLGKKIEGLEKKINGFGPFSFSGDFRLRDEPFIGGPLNQSQVRNRERYRARLYMNAKLNDDISGGLAFATGDIHDPITSNQTTNQFITRKPFYLDRAWVTYTPHQFKPLTLVGGKFSYPWYRTELTWDNDINPEGLAQKLEWKSDNWKVLRQFALIGFELPFAETSKTNALTFTPGTNALFNYPNSSIKQSVVYGGQIQTLWQLTSWLKLTADTAFYNYHNADPIALANQAQNASSPDLGLLKLNNSLTNSYQLTKISFTVPVAPGAGTCTVGPGGTCTTTTVNSGIVGAKLNSKFALSDTIVQFDIKTPSAKWPIRLLADYVQNTEACANHPALGPLTAAQLATLPANATVSTSTTNGACNPRYRRGNWLEARFGRQAEKGDWQFSYTHMLIEREAVMSLFDFSDMRQGSNVAQNRVEVFYNAYKNVQLGFTGLFGRPLASTEPTLKRLQFDVAYKF
ncbi:MAG: putative porin [Acidobacteriia bacterium]|nr:putative porin [Terriglobia bacterium]